MMRGSPATPSLLLVLVSPRLVWRVGLPGAPDCCHEHACQTRQFSEAPGRRWCPFVLGGGVMETVVERPAALDIHKAQVTACVRVPGEGRAREQHVAEFSTTVRGLLTLRDWLAAHRVTQVTMEATGVYWKPVWAILEDEFELLLVNARHVKQVPGRKTDISDAAWLCQLAEAGLLQRSFVPPKPIRALRNLTRYRKAQIGERQREANRLHKILEDTGIKLDCVATDILGVSGRAMLDALVRGTTDPAVLAELARGRLRAKIPALREALEGRFGDEHALVVSSILAHIDFLDQHIERLSPPPHPPPPPPPRPPPPPPPAGPRPPLDRRLPLDPRRLLAHALHRRALSR